VREKEEGNNYLLYLKKADLSAPTVDAQVYILTGDSCVQALSATLELPQ